MKHRLVLLSVGLVVAIFFLGFAKSSTDTISGKWNAKVITKSIRRPKQFSEITLKLQANGDKLTGSATALRMQGEPVITNGKIEGDTISFTIVFNESNSTTGVPELKFKGNVHGDEIKLNLIWHYSGWGNDTSKDMPLEMEGGRVVEP
jgi:hypothetical protein